MIDVIVDTIIDGFKVLPFLFVAFLIIEVRILGQVGM